MSKIDYDTATLTITCFRKHLLLDSKYYLYVLPNLLVLASNPKQQNPKYQIPLSLTSKIVWQTRQKSPIIEQFGFLYKNQIKYFNGLQNDLLKLKEAIQGSIMYKDISDFYSPICMLGKGGSSKVYLVTKKGDTDQYASKCVDKRYLQEDGGFTALFNEIELMQQLKHQNIIRLVDLYEGDNTFYMILEYLEGKSLHELMNHRRSIFEQEQIQKILKLLLNAVEYMHSKGIMHRDLKPENIMFKSLNQLDTLKIVDFGLATSINTDPYPFPKCGTPGYVAPEIANLKDLSKRYTMACDEFSIGCIFYKLCTGKELFPGNDYQEILKLNKKCNISLDTLLIYKTPPEAIDLIGQLLKLNPSERIDCKTALQHPYFNSKFETKKTRFQNANVNKINPVFQTQNFSNQSYLMNMQQLEEDNVEEENCRQIKVPIMGHLKSFAGIHGHRGSLQPTPTEPRKNFKKFQTSEFDQYMTTISPISNNYKPSLILNSDTYNNSPNPDKQSTKSIIKQNCAKEIHFMYKIDEEQEETQHHQK